MATGTQQGTGKHPHKSAEHPEPVHEAPTTTGKGKEHESSHSASGSHDGGSHNGGSHNGGSHNESGSHTSGKNGGENIESRAYTGPDGQEHYHTKAYMEQHKGGM